METQETKNTWTNLSNDDFNEDFPNYKVITLIIPCHNEEAGLPRVISEIPFSKLNQLGYVLDVLVINNNSTDHTEQVARTLGARVINEQRQGKGRAIKTAFLNLHPRAEYVVMLDGDATYKAHEIPRLIEPLENNFCDVIIGSRLEGKMNGKSMQMSHRLANWFFTFMVRRFYFANVTDTCTGFFAWKRSVIEGLNGHIKSKGFAIEAEMITKMARMGYRIFSVPITYDKRADQSKSKLVPIADGIKITKMLLRNMNWRPPHNPNQPNHNKSNPQHQSYIQAIQYQQAQQQQQQCQQYQTPEHQTPEHQAPQQIINQTQQANQQTQQTNQQTQQTNQQIHQETRELTKELSIEELRQSLKDKFNNLKPLPHVENNLKRGW